MKTLFISISRGVLVRNILRAGVLDFLLKNDDLRIVIISSREIKEYFRKEFEHPRIILEYAPGKPFGRFRKFFIILFNGLVYTISERRILKYGTMGKSPDKFYCIKHAAFTVLSRFPIFRRIARWIEATIFIDKDMDYLFIKYKPDLLFCSSIYGTGDVFLIKSARRFGVKSLSMPKSWDTIGRLFFRIPSDKIILNNEAMKEWIKKEQLIKEDDMHVSGLPQFDIYKNKNNYKTRDEMFRITGLDPLKPVILFASEGLLVHWDETYIDDLINNYRILDRYNLIIRPHFTNLIEKKFERFKSRKGVYIDDEHLRITDMFGDRWDPTGENMDWLCEVLNFTDVVAAFMSTFVLDAMVFDKPVVNIYYDLPVAGKRITPIHELYKYIHYQMVLSEGGIAVARTGREAMNWIEKYVADPGIFREERKRTVNKFCYKADGHSCERIADIIKRYL